jgi:antitoxin FitA
VIREARIRSAFLGCRRAAIGAADLMAARSLWRCQASMLSLIAMAQLIVRNLPSQVVVSLKRRAAERNRSAEAEHREILLHALLDEAPGSLKATLAEMPDVGTDEDFARPRARRREVDF